MGLVRTVANMSGTGSGAGVVTPFSVMIDGYQQTPNPRHCCAGGAGQAYDFQPGTFYTLDANAVICTDLAPFSGAYSDIRHPEVFWAAISAAGLSH